MEFDNKTILTFFIGIISVLVLGYVMSGCRMGAGYIGILDSICTDSGGGPPIGYSVYVSGNINASRLSGVAPLAVFFDGIGQLQWSEIEDNEFVWDFGPGTENDASSSGRYFTGYMAAHVFETPGQYNVILTLKKDGAVVGTSSVTIDVQPFTGRTICASQVSDFISCPSANAADHYSSLLGAWNSITTNTRLLLHRDESFDISSAGAPLISQIGPVIIGDYGLGNKPIIIFLIM